MNVSRPAQSVRWSSLSAHRSALGDQLTLSECDSACAERILPRIERMLTCTVAWDGERSSSGPACDDSAWTELSPACSLRLETKGKLLPALSRTFDDGGLLVRNRAECLLADRYRGSGMLPPATPCSSSFRLVLPPLVSRLPPFRVLLWRLRFFPHMMIFFGRSCACAGGRRAVGARVEEGCAARRAHPGRGKVQWKRLLSVSSR